MCLVPAAHLGGHPCPSLGPSVWLQSFSFQLLLMTPKSVFPAQTQLLAFLLECATKDCSSLLVGPPGTPNSLYSKWSSPLPIICFHSPLPPLLANDTTSQLPEMKTWELTLSHPQQPSTSTPLTFFMFNLFSPFPLPLTFRSSLFLASMRAIDL